jgi:hypothetical protein
LFEIIGDCGDEYRWLLHYFDLKFYFIYSITIY